jgi:hypothetical protein
MAGTAREICWIDSAARALRSSWSRLAAPWSTHEGLLLPRAELLGADLPTRWRRCCRTERAQPGAGGLEERTVKMLRMWTHYE